MVPTVMRTRPQEASISFPDLLSAITNRRGFIIWSIVFAAEPVLLFSIHTLRTPARTPYSFRPNKHTLEVPVRLTESPGNSLSSNLQNAALGTRASLTGISSSATGPTNADLAMAPLVGSTLAGRMTTHFDFVKRYHITKDPR